VEEARR